MINIPFWNATLATHFTSIQGTLKFAQASDRRELVSSAQEQADPAPPARARGHLLTAQVSVQTLQTERLLPSEAWQQHQCPWWCRDVGNEWNLTEKPSKAGHP